MDVVEDMDHVFNVNDTVFKYTRKVRKNQIVTAGRLVTVLDMHPQLRGTRTNNNDPKFAATPKQPLKITTHAQMLYGIIRARDQTHPS